MSVCFCVNDCILLMCVINIIYVTDSTDVHVENQFHIDFINDSVCSLISTSFSCSDFQIINIYVDLFSFFDVRYLFISFHIPIQKEIPLSLCGGWWHFDSVKVKLSVCYESEREKPRRKHQEKNHEMKKKKRKRNNKCKSSPKNSRIGWHMIVTEKVFLLRVVWGSKN